MLRVVGVLVLAFALLNVSSSLNLLGLSGGAATAAGTTASANVTVSNGVQTVRMTQGPGGYEPADTVLYAGMPTTWLIEGTSKFDCSAALRVPDLGISVNLAEGVNTVRAAGHGCRDGALHLRHGHVLGQPPRRRPTRRLGHDRRRGCRGLVVNRGLRPVDVTTGLDRQRPRVDLVLNGPARRPGLPSSSPGTTTDGTVGGSAVAGQGGPSCRPPTPEELACTRTAAGRPSCSGPPPSC